ncbi:gag-pol fusion protein [Gigaspora margarita]|uniref:Gag-pol fusion protein n=1 Tax=Gigaspora margarita TaxID=4874 RepID=A0A8H4ADU6_GIGMA|nr:gag-pol fusion protein [Gigaspora margarita]
MTTEQHWEKATSHEGENAKKEKTIDPSNRITSILDQPLPSNLPIPLVLNSKIKTPDVSQPPIEVIYCEATIEQQLIYLILDTGSSKSLISYEFLKKIRKEIDKPSVRNLIDVHGQRKYPLGVVENLPIIVNKVEIPIDVEVTEAKDYAVIVGTDWLEKAKTPYNLGKPVSLREKSGINSEEIDKKENEKEYETEEVKEERSYIVQRDEDKLPIVKIKRNAMKESCTRCKELFQDIETLECLVDNLDEELEISQETQEYTNLEKNQQAKVEELMKNNKVLFAKGLMQLRRTKEEMHSITLKEG